MILDELAVLLNTITSLSFLLVVFTLWARKGMFFDVLSQKYEASVVDNSSMKYLYMLTIELLCRFQLVILLVLSLLFINFILLVPGLFVTGTAQEAISIYIIVVDIILLSVIGLHFLIFAVTLGPTQYLFSLENEDVGHTLFGRGDLYDKYNKLKSNN